MSYLIKIAYDGSKFYGFQRLNEEVTVQKTLEEALTKINKQNVVIKGAGRTDRGVHANCQCASFSLDINIDSEGLKEALNSLVKPYIYIKDVIEVDDEFHARFDVTKKRYVYKINLGEYNPIMNDYVYQCPYELDLDLMREVANLYIGGHDFRNFVSGERDNYDCIIYDIDFDIKNDILSITFEGKSFYRYMVRNLVGAMIEVARGKISIDYVREMLESKEEKTTFTAPANGLYLDFIEYN
jgi:tRNA pseudouridine38-40 synthase